MNVSYYLYVLQTNYNPRQGELLSTAGLNLERLCPQRLSDNVWTHFWSSQFGVGLVASSEQRSGTLPNNLQQCAGKPPSMIQSGDSAENEKRGWS